MNSDHKQSYTFIDVLQFNNQSTLRVPLNVSFKVGKVVIQPLVATTRVYTPGTYQTVGVLVAATTTTTVTPANPADPIIVVLKSRNNDIPILGSYVDVDNEKSASLHNAVHYSYGTGRDFDRDLVIEAWSLEPYSSLDITKNILVQIQFFEF